MTKTIPTLNAAILAASREHLNVKEWPGSKHNPKVLEYFEDVGHGWVDNDETPWCAAFHGSIMGEVGLEGTGSLTAKSYLNWGQKVSLQDALPGDTVIFNRGDPNGPFGHVATLLKVEGDKIWVRGGNQGNAVSDKPYEIERLAGIRRPVAKSAGNNRPALRKGDRGAFVEDVQEHLRFLGHFPGEIDGIFGPATEAAVLALQARAGLETDGVVGRETWGKLQLAVPKPDRDIDEAELRARGSKTLQEASKVDMFAWLGGIVSTGREVATAAQEADGLLDTITVMVLDHWPALVVIGVLTFGFLLFSRRIKSARVKDAQTGANMGR